MRQKVGVSEVTVSNLMLLGYVTVHDCSYMLLYVFVARFLAEIVMLLFLLLGCVEKRRQKTNRQILSSSENPILATKTHKRPHHHHHPPHDEKNLWDQKKNRKYKLLVPRDKHVKKPPELFIRPRGHERPPVLDKYPTDMTAMQVKSPHHNGERDWAVGHLDAALHSKKAAEMFKDMANIKTNHDVDVRNKENEDEIPRLKMENPSRVPPPLSNALAGEKLKISFWTFGLTKTQRLGVLRDLVKRTPVVDLGTLPSGYRQLLKDHIKRSKAKLAKRKDSSKSSRTDSGLSAKKYIQGGKPQQPPESPLVTSGDRRELSSDRLIKEKHTKHWHSSSSLPWSSSPSSSAASKTHERKENSDQHSGRYNGTSPSGGATKSHSSKTDHKPSKGHGHRSSGVEGSCNRPQKSYTTDVKSHREAKRDVDVFKRPQSWDSQKKPDPGPRKAPYITTANTTLVLEPSKYSQSSTTKEHSHPISSKDMQRQIIKGCHWSREHSPAASGSNSYSRSEQSSKERTSSSKDVGSTGSAYKANTSSSSKSVAAISSSVHKDFKTHSSKGSRDHSQHSSKVSASNSREAGNHPTKRLSSGFKDPHPVRESPPGSKESVAHPTKVSSSGSRDSTSGRVVSSSTSSSNYKNSFPNLKNLSGFSANTSPSKSTHQGSVHSGKDFSSIRKNSSGSSEELLHSRSKSSVQGQRDYHSSSSKHIGSRNSSSSSSSSIDNSKYSRSSVRNYNLPVKAVSSVSPTSSQSSSSSLSSSSSSSHRSGATAKTSSALSSSHSSNGSDKPRPLPSGSDKPRLLPSGSDKPKPSPSGSDKPKLSPIGNDKPKITPTWSDKPKTTHSGSDRPQITPNGSDKISASQGSTTATELAKQIIQISSKNILTGTEAYSNQGLAKKDGGSSHSHTSSSSARSGGNQAQLSSHLTGRRHSEGENQKSQEDSESRGPMQQRRSSSSPISKLVKSDLKTRSTQDNNKPVTTYSPSDDIIHTHSSRQLAFSNSAEGKKASHISGIKPDFAQSYPPNISSSPSSSTSSASASASASSPTDRDISLLPTNKTRRNRYAVLHVSPLQGKESPSHTESPQRTDADVRPGAQETSPPPETSPPSKPRDAPYTTINSNRSFIDAFRGTFRSPSPVPLPVRVKIEALENREQEKSGAQATEKEPIVLPSSRKSPLSAVIPSKAPKTQIVEPTMQKVTTEESIINFGMRLPVLVPPKSSDLTQVSIKPNAQVVSMSSLEKETSPLHGATNVVADKTKTAVVVGSSIPAISATAIVTDSLQSNEKRVPTLTNEKTLNKDADEYDEFEETADDSQDKEAFESQKGEKNHQSTAPETGEETETEGIQQTVPEREEQATTEPEQEVTDKPEEEAVAEAEDKVQDQQENQPEEEPEPEVEDEPEDEVGKKQETEGDKDPDYYDVFDFDQHEKQLMAEKATVQSKFVESGDVEFTDNLGNADNDNETDNELSKMTKGDSDCDSDEDDGICGDHVVPNAVDLQERPDSQADSEATEGKGLFTLSEHVSNILIHWINTFNVTFLLTDSKCQTNVHPRVFLRTV